MARRSVPTLGTVLAAVLVACAVTLLAVPERAEAAFPGVNGKIAYTTKACNDFSGDPCPDSEIASMRPDGTDRKQLTDNLLDDEYPAFSPDGNKIAFHRSRGGAFSYDIFTVGGGGRVTKLTDRAETDFQPAFSPDGQSIVFSRDDGDIYVMSADGTGVRKITDHPEDFYAETPVWSPDGTKIAFAGTTFDAEGNGNLDIWTMDADGTNHARLTDDPRSDYDPTWSPDGTRIAFATGRAEEGEPFDDSDIYVMSADGTDERDLTRNANLNEYDPTWSPGGGKIAFVGYRGGDQEIFKINTNGTGWTNLTNTPDIQEYQPDWGRRPVTQATP